METLRLKRTHDGSNMWEADRGEKQVAIYERAAAALGIAPDQTELTLAVLEEGEVVPEEGQIREVGEDEDDADRLIVYGNGWKHYWDKDELAEEFGCEVTPGRYAITVRRLPEPETWPVVGMDTTRYCGKCAAFLPYGVTNCPQCCAHLSGTISQAEVADLIREHMKQKAEG